ncbi:hypothetical protein Mapa_017100 [Marchantia paleacea]|nr:hypothetical protein Mapa_017100 [Marchantia paleacea]
MAPYNSKVIEKLYLDNIDRYSLFGLTLRETFILHTNLDLLSHSLLARLSSSYSMHHNWEQVKDLKRLRNTLDDKTSGDYWELKSAKEN